MQAAGGPKRKIVGLEMVDRGIARDGYPVLDLDGYPIGSVTSGSPAPFLKTNIAMALVPAAVAASGDRRDGPVPRQSGKSEAGAAAVLQAAEKVTQLSSAAPTPLLDVFGVGQADPNTGAFQYLAGWHQQTPYGLTKSPSQPR